MQRPQCLKKIYLRWIASRLTYFCFEQYDIYRYGLFSPEINTWHPYWTNTLWHTWEFTNTALYCRINTSRFRITKMQIMLHIEDTPKMSLTCHFIHPFSHGLLLSMYSIWLSIIQQWMRLLERKLTIWIYLTLLIIFRQLRILYPTPTSSI